MSGPKTRPSENSVAEFIGAVEPEQKRKDCWTLVEMMREITGAGPVMWGSSIVGFDTYVNTPFNTTNPPANWPITGFSPRKANLTLYITPGFSRYGELMDKLGKHTTGKFCLYIKKLADVDQVVLKELVAQSVAYMRATYPSK